MAVLLRSCTLVGIPTNLCETSDYAPYSVVCLSGQEDTPVRLFQKFIAVPSRHSRFMALSRRPGLAKASETLREVLIPSFKSVFEGLDLWS